MSLIERLRLGLRESQQTVAAFALVLLTDDIGYLQCGCTRTFGIRKDMELSHIKLVQEPAGLLKTLRCLAPTAHHHIHTDEGIGHLLLDFPNLVGKERTVIMTVHQPEHLIAATLQGNMEMGHEMGTKGTIVDEFIGEQVGFKTADTITFNTLNPVECLHQVEERLTRRLPEVADVHTGEHNLLPPRFHRLFCLLHQRSNRRVAAKATGKRNGAIGAEIVTSVLYLQEETCTVASRTAGSKGCYLLGLHCIVLMERVRTRPLSASTHGFHPLPCQELHQLGLLIGTQHQIHTLNLAHRLGFELRIASCHYHKSTWIAACHPANGLPALMVGHLRYRTGVDETEVGFLAFLHLAKSHLL